MVRIPAQLLLLTSTLMGFATSACLLPADFKGDQKPGPYPPQVNRETLRPKSARTQLWTGCTDSSPQLSAEIVDLDSEELQFRWVANNGVMNTRLLDDDDSMQNPGEVHRASQTINHADDFGFERTDKQFTGVISLFVTDGPYQAWAEDPNSVEPGEARDLGRIDDPSLQFSVIEVRWTFEYLSDLGAGQCQLED